MNKRKGSIDYAITSAYAHRNPDSKEPIYTEPQIFDSEEVLPVDLVQQTVNNIGRGILERNLKKGSEIEIPSLDIVITND